MVEWITIHIPAKLAQYLYQARGDEVKLICYRLFHGNSILFLVMFSVFLGCSRCFSVVLGCCR